MKIMLISGFAINFGGGKGGERWFYKFFLKSLDKFNISFFAFFCFFFLFLDIVATHTSHSCEGRNL